MDRETNMKYLYFEHEVEDAYDGNYFVVDKVPMNLVKIFLYEYMNKGLEVRLIYDGNEPEDAELYQLDKIPPLADIRPTQIIKDLKTSYKDFVYNWANTGQNPNERGCSIGVGIWTQSAEDEVRSKYSENDFVDERLESEMEKRKLNNTELSNKRAYYKALKDED